MSNITRSSYFRLFTPTKTGECIAALVQEVHRQTIQQGLILERCIQKHIPHGEFNVQYGTKKYDFVYKDHVYEIKDGCAFDSKKISGEIQSLRMHPASVKSMVFWSARDRNDIHFPFKGDDIRIMTGRDFCNEHNINFDDIQNERYRSRDQYTDDIVESMRMIVSHYDNSKSRDASC